jgi:hypothetical protein
MQPDRFANDEDLALLTTGERAMWDSYQRFLHCIVLPGPLSYDAVAVTAALLALATATVPPAPVAKDEAQGLPSRD